MDCSGVASHLVAYHLGTVTDEERDAVEAHIVECSACLVTYLALKRAADRAELERPRPEVRERLRAEVASSFQRPSKATGEPRGPSESRARLTLFARRIPLYQGVALAAVAAAIALAAPGLLQRVSLSGAMVGAPSIDTARTRAESLQIY
jgi:anti-sigma factor RsiW